MDEELVKNLNLDQEGEEFEAMNDQSKEPVKVDQNDLGLKETEFNSEDSKLAIEVESIEPIEKEELSQFGISIDALNSLDYLCKMNDQLEYEEDFNRHKRPLRQLIYRQEILHNDLLKIYRSISTSLITNCQEVLTDFKKSCKIVQTHAELTKLLVNLTSPLEMLLVNKKLIFRTLTSKAAHATLEEVSSLLFTEEAEQNEQKTDEYSEPAPQSPSNPELANLSIQSLATLSIQNFKKYFIFNHYLVDLYANFNFLIDFYHSLSASLANPGLALGEKKAKQHIFRLVSDDLVLNICLLRNILLEANEKRLCMLINLMFDNNLELIILNSINLHEKSKRLVNEEKHFVLLGKRLSFFFCLFSKLNHKRFSIFIFSKRYLHPNHFAHVLEDQWQDV